MNTARASLVEDLLFHLLLHHCEDCREHHQHRVKNAKFEHRRVTQFFYVVSDFSLDRVTLAPDAVLSRQPIEERIAGSPAEGSIDNRLRSFEDFPAGRCQGLLVSTAATTAAFFALTMVDSFAQSTACTIAA